MIKIGATGTQVTTGGASTRTAIPNDSNGTLARWVRVQALANCYVKPGDGTVTATVNDMLLSPNEAVILDVRGCSNIASIQETAAAKYNITPLDNQPP